MPYSVKEAIEEFKKILEKRDKINLIESLSDDDIAVLLEAADSAVYIALQEQEVRTGPIWWV